MHEVSISMMKPGGTPIELGRFTFEHIPRTGEYVVIEVDGADQAVRVGEIIHAAQSTVPAFTKLVVDF